MNTNTTNELTVECAYSSFLEGNYAQCNRILHTIQAGLSEYTDKTDYIQFLNYKLQMFAVEHSYEVTCRFLLQSIQRASKWNDYEMLALSYFLLSKCYYTQNKIKESAYECSMALYFIRSSKRHSYEVELKIFNHYILCLIQLGKGKKAAQVILKNGGIKKIELTPVVTGAQAYNEGHFERAWSIFYRYVKQVPKEKVIEYKLVLAQIQFFVSSYINIGNSEVFKNLLYELSQLQRAIVQVPQQHVDQFDNQSIQQFLKDGQHIVNSHVDIQCIMLNAQQTNSSILDRLCTLCEQRVIQALTYCRVNEHIVLLLVEDVHMLATKVKLQQLIEHDYVKMYDEKLTNEEMKKKDFFDIYTQLVYKMYI